MPIDLKIAMSGLMAYDIDDKRINVLILASRESKHAHGDHSSHIDRHIPALVLPLGGHLDKETSAADMVFDAGDTEYGMWLLSNVIVDVRVDGKFPDGEVKFSRQGSGEKPTKSNEDSLFWLANISKAVGLRKQLKFRSDCLPPNPNPALITSVVRVTDGTVVAQWPHEKAKEEVWDFSPLPDSGPKGRATPPDPYRSALADGIRWSFRAKERIEILLLPTDSRAMRQIVIKAVNKESPNLLATISNKPATVGGSPSHVKTLSVSHFLAFYDLVEPAPPLETRRIPTLRRITTKTSRCPGSSA